MKRRFWVCGLLAVLLSLLMLSRPTFSDPVVRLSILHLNDVDEIAPVSGRTHVRLLPFGGPVALVDLPSSLWQRVPEQDEHNQGAGEPLQMANIRRSVDGTAWLIHDKPLEDKRVYRAAVNDFLLTGQEHGLAFLIRDLPDLRVVQDDGVDIRQALIAQQQTDFGPSGVAAAAPPAACLPPEAFPLEQLPSVKLTLQPSRRQLPIGAPWSITGLVENQSAAPIYITNRFTALTLPVEVLGARVTAVPATFPTMEGTLAQPAHGYQVVKVFPQHTYPVVWHVEPLTSVYRITELLVPGVQNWSQLFSMLWSDMRHMLFFHPHPYQIAATVHYWKTNPQAYLDCLQQSVRQVDVSTAPSVMTTMVVDLEASTWVILFGAWLGSVTAYLFLVCMRKRPWSVSGFLGSWLLGPTVALFLKRLGDAVFLVTINVNDFWGAIVIGYIAQYIGLQIIDRYVIGRPASELPPAQPSPPPAPAGGTVDAPARRA
jgi:hypothetical protein